MFLQIYQSKLVLEEQRGEIEGEGCHKISTKFYEQTEVCCF